MSQSKVEDVLLDEIDEQVKGKNVLSGNPLDIVKNVQVPLKVVLGDTSLSVSDFMELKEKSVLPLNQNLNEPIDVLLEGKVVARGNLVAVGDQFGIQITELNNK